MGPISVYAGLFHLNGREHIPRSLRYRLNPTRMSFSRPQAKTRGFPPLDDAHSKGACKDNRMTTRDRFGVLERTNELLAGASVGLPKDRPIAFVIAHQ